MISYYRVSFSTTFSDTTSREINFVQLSLGGYTRYKYINEQEKKTYLLPTRSGKIYK